MDHKSIWQIWATQLQRWHLQDFAAWLLESASPVHVVSAQLVYVGQPFFEVFVPNGQFEALANLLEQPAQAKAFAAFLRDKREF